MFIKLRDFTTHSFWGEGVYILLVSRKSGRSRAFIQVCGCYNNFLQALSVTCHYVELFILSSPSSSGVTSGEEVDPAALRRSSMLYIKTLIVDKYLLIDQD